MKNKNNFYWIVGIVTILTLMLMSDCNYQMFINSVNDTKLTPYYERQDDEMNERMFYHHQRIMELFNKSEWVEVTIKLNDGFDVDNFTYDKEGFNIERSSSGNYMYGDIRKRLYENLITNPAIKFIEPRAKATTG